MFLENETRHQQGGTHREKNKWCVKGKRGGVDHIYTAEHENDDLSQKKEE